MRILFSADWHLGYTLQGANTISRLDDQIRQIRRIVEYIEEHDVDVLAIAGDVFESQDRGPALNAARRMVTALQGPLARGLKVVAIAGNHDRDYFMDTANVWLGIEAREGGGPFLMRTRPELLTVSAGGESVNFALLPYPYPSRYAAREDGAPESAAQRNEQIGALFINTMARLQEQAALTKLPTVLLAHVTIQGVTVGAHRLSARDDVVIPRGAFPDFELSVIGHIHKAERIGGEHFYYVGALDRMDAGERDYQPRVLLADIGPSGLRSIESLPLDPTPIEEVFASSEEELVSARTWMKQPDRALVKLTLRVPYGHYTAPLIARARELFPRLYGNVEHTWEDRPQITPSAAELNPVDVPGTVQKYLEQQELPEDERAELIALVDELLRTNR